MHESKEDQQREHVVPVVVHQRGSPVSRLMTAPPMIFLYFELRLPGMVDLLAECPCADRRGGASYLSPGGALGWPGNDMTVQSTTQFSSVASPPRYASMRWWYSQALLAAAKFAAASGALESGAHRGLGKLSAAHSQNHRKTTAQKARLATRRQPKASSLGMGSRISCGLYPAGSLNCTPCSTPQAIIESSRSDHFLFREIGGRAAEVHKASAI